MRVAVIIVSYKNVDDVVKCLNALAATTYENFEVLICENGGAEAAARLAPALPGKLAGGQGVQLIHADNPGYAGALNICMAERPLVDAWWILNPDTEPKPGALGALVERLEKGDVQAVGGVVAFADGKVQASGGIWRPWIARAHSIRDDPGGSPEEAARKIEARQNYLHGASLLVSRRYLEVVGPLREDYFLYAEEIEWCVRGVAKSMRLGHAPGAQVIHSHGTTTGMGESLKERPRLPIYLDERNKLLVVRDTKPILFPVAAMGALAFLGLRYLPRRAFRQFSYGLQGWLAALRNERGKPSFLAS